MLHSISRVVVVSVVALSLNIAMVPAVVGAYAASPNGALSMLIAALIPLLLIECAYLITMLVVARFKDAKPAAETVEPREPVPADLRLQGKPQVREEP